LYYYYYSYYYFNRRIRLIELHLFAGAGGADKRFAAKSDPAHCPPVHACPPGAALRRQGKNPTAIETLEKVKRKRKQNSENKNGQNQQEALQKNAIQKRPQRIRKKKNPKKKKKKKKKKKSPKKPPKNSQNNPKKKSFKQNDLLCEFLSPRLLRVLRLPTPLL
jgi:hypothetical protein